MNRVSVIYLKADNTLYSQGIRWGLKLKEGREPFATHVAILFESEDPNYTLVYSLDHYGMRIYPYGPYWESRIVAQQYIPWSFFEEQHAVNVRSVLEQANMSIKPWDMLGYVLGLTNHLICTGFVELWLGIPVTNPTPTELYHKINRMLYDEANRVDTGVQDGLSALS